MRPDKNKKKFTPPNPLEGFFKQGLPKVTYNDLLATFYERGKLIDSGGSLDEFARSHAARMRMVYNPAALSYPDHSTGSYYPDIPLDKTDNTHLDRPNNLEIEAKTGVENCTRLQSAIPNCASFFIPGSCGSGHRHIKATVCSLEWCVDCGKDGSFAHNRRQERWNVGKYEKFTDIGYMVVTIPSELWHEFKDKALLQKFRRYFIRKLKRTRIDGTSSYIEKPYRYTTKEGKVRSGIRKVYKGYENGFCRYHYAGDCESCKGKGCQDCLNTGAGNKFKPHLNILLNETYISRALLNQFKTDVATWMKKEFNLSYLPKKNINYRYVSTKDKFYTEKKYHRLRYVTRATWRHYDKEITEVLHGFHTASSWGRFDGGVQCETHTSETEKGNCFRCLQETGEIQKVVWEGRLTRKEAEKVLLLYDHVENGYFVRDGKPPDLLKN